MTSGHVGAQAATIDEVIGLFDAWGGDNYDEELSQLEHALQTAALAVHEGAPDELVVAALLHDVGHLLELEAADGDPDIGTTDHGHEALGARYLGALFPPPVTRPIALHVRAKRYRCAVDEAYLDCLSNGSRASLHLQGGPLNPDDVASFEANPGFDGAVRLRGWDDGGKVEGLEVAPLDSYRALLDRVARIG